MVEGRSDGGWGGGKRQSREIFAGTVEFERVTASGYMRVETLKDIGEGLSRGVRGAGQLEVPQRQWLGLPEHGEEAAGGGGGGAPLLLGVLRLELRVGRPSATAFGRMGVCAGAPH